MFSNPNRNCLLMSPGRTGSVLITTFLSKVTNMFPIIRQHNNNIKPLAAKEILHSHDPLDFSLCNENTVYILSTRNMIDCAFSRIIAYRNKKYRYYGNKDLYEIKQYRIETYDFERAYQYAVTYYDAIRDKLPIDTIKIDYSQFSDDPYKLIDIFNISKMTARFFTDKHLIPIKTPGSYRDYIINYDEIYEYGKTFDPNPPI